MDDDLVFWEDNFSCPICKTEKCVNSVGSKHSKILLVGSEPGDEELQKGIPMVGPMGRVLRTELLVLGLDIKQTRRTNIWKHPPNENKECFEHGVMGVLEDAEGKEAILLMGDEVVGYFTGMSVSKVNGLPVKSYYLSAPIIYACLNPAIVFKKSGVGEIRFALRNFVEALSGNNII